MMRQGPGGWGGLALAGILGLAVASGHAQDERVVEIDTLSVRDTLYHLTGGGGNAMALVDEVTDPGGVVLVDTKRPGWGAATMEVIGQVTDLPVRTIINTHAHPGHAGSNAEFPEVVEIIAHANTAARLAAASPRPLTTFTDRHSLLDGLDRIDLYYFGRAHTDGDVVVVFPAKGVAYLGDLFPTRRVPAVDLEQGGSGLAFPDTLDAVVSGIDGVQRVISGHGPFPSTYAGRGRRERGADRAWTGFLTWDDLSDYAAFTRAFVEAVEQAHQAGRTVADAAASVSLPAQFDDYDLSGAEATVDAIYRELAAR